MNLTKNFKPKAGRVLADASNSRRKWVSPVMGEFRSSSVGNPWVLDLQGELMLSGKRTGPAAPQGNMTLSVAPPMAQTKAPSNVTMAASALPKRKPIFKGPPSSIVQDSPVGRKVGGPRPALDNHVAESMAGSRKGPSLIRTTRDHINQVARRPSGNSDDTRTRSAIIPLATSSAATCPVRRTAAEKARQNLFDDWYSM
ncbi:hypothetical protein K438DRAFT_1747125 [Mycena galopus ATCC 62051]|nr:hypothetical protein K438DRAFT_1747125 [Mycena galopus ATCC 62051]